MFRTLLTPLSARFSFSPRLDGVQDLPNAPEDPAPEDFARDVLVELMRNSIDRLKAAEDLKTRIEVLSEIHRILLQDSCTKDVFREMDGFLVLMSMLASLHSSPVPSTARSDDHRADGLEATRLVFVIFSEAMHHHRQNMHYFKNSVTYESLEQALQGVLSDDKAAIPTLELLVSLALHDFSFSGLFAIKPGTEFAELNRHLQQFEPRFGSIRHPEALLIVFDVIPRLYPDNAALRYCVYKLLERLASHNHRNQCVLNNLGLVSPLFLWYYDAKSDAGVPKEERQVVQRLLRKLIDVSTTTEEARLMFQRVVRDDDILDADVLEVLRAGMKVRWPEHFSLESPATLRVAQSGVRGLPITGFTFMVWIWVEKLPTRHADAIFTCRLRDQALFTLSVRPDGAFACHSSGSNSAAVLQATAYKSRWTHVAVAHYPHRASNPTIRLFVDGALVASQNWPYPKSANAVSTVDYVLGDLRETATLSWCVASVYMLSVPLVDPLLRFIHHLGPRYTGRFQAADLVKFLTYEASTALNIHLSSSAQDGAVPPDVVQLRNVIKNGPGINPAAILFTVTPSSPISDESDEEKEAEGLRAAGDVVVARSGCLDLAMWKIGGAALPLRLVQLATNPHEVSRSLGILTDGLRNSWQNSEDTERLRGYDILAEILREKSSFINITGFETLFEFLGLDFRSPDHSTITNTVAYRVVALDFQLWSRTKAEIQRVHLEHFATLLELSKYKHFNVKQRIAKMGVVRKLLFVLQTAWYPYEMLPFLIDAMRVVASAHFTADDAIKPIISYLAANLHDAEPGIASPGSILSRIDHKHSRATAEMVFEMLVTLLQAPDLFQKFTIALPLTRIILLLIGERPTPTTAALVLRMIRISLDTSSTYSRKFELVSGWNVLKSVLPHAWDSNVQRAAFDVLLKKTNDVHNPVEVRCTNILPAIFSVLKSGLETIEGRATGGHSPIDVDSATLEENAEHLLEELIELHSTCLSFRHIFKSSSITQAFIDAYQPFVTTMQNAPEVSQTTIRILEKLSHLALSIALDESVAGSQKREIMEILQAAETALNPRTDQETRIDSVALVGGKARKRRLASVRLSVQLGEGTVKRSMSRIHEWRKNVAATEKKRLRKMILDLREHHRQVSALTEWALSLTTERGLWAKDGLARRWRLDETEGPHRVRKKMEPAEEKTSSSKFDATSRVVDLQEAESESQSLKRVEVPPWAESYEMSSTDVDDQLEEEILDDKHRRVRHELEPGDVIEAASTVARVFGVDSSPGLLIFGRTHLYMLDGLVENDDGEIIEAHEAPRRLFFVPGSIVELDGPQKAQRWSLEQVASYSDRTFLFRDVALEIYFRDSRSLLVVFLEKRQRREIDDRLSTLVSRPSVDSLTPGLMASPGGLMSPLRSPLVGRIGSKVGSTLNATVLSGFRMDELATAQRKWQAREISNFTYLSILNQISGRTPSDATQYPVYPWVLSDYSSASLDLNSPESFRDLSCPMGALTPARREAAHSRYVNLESVGEKPFHYGTHFSSSMIVCHFLIRMEPFTHMFKTLQGGDWDLPDRLFSDVKRSYESASQDLRGDVRELIPEFFACPEFLENSNNLDFGVRQGTGEKIHDVKLPPWAKQDPLLFITLHRRALESDYVSEHLPKWIDLIWGCKQRDPDSLNVFHPLSYEGSIDLDAITDDLEREATVGIIHNFGQTPRKIFNAPHPERMMHGISSLPLGTIYGIAEDYHLLSQSPKPVKDLGPASPVRELYVDVISERVIPCGPGTLYVPLRSHEHIEWDLSPVSGGELRLVVDRKVVQVVEAAHCSCATFADSATLVTGSMDHTVRLWHLQRPSGQIAARGRDRTPSLVIMNIMRAHTAEVLCVAASRAWSLVVSGSKDGSAALWDLNRGIYVRSIWHGSGNDHEVHLAAINESTGYIATCSRERLWLHTVNAQPIVSLDVSVGSVTHAFPPVTSLAFLERDYCRKDVLATGGPDGVITLRTWDADDTFEGEKAQWKFRTLRELKVKGLDGERQIRGQTSAVMALRFVGETLFHGEDSGRTFSWVLPD
ncbi:beach-domain-containing protein [Obba rivulosa]|uniref:Beach-domain-containing protein n=1 Tax=Obba rivulosa TaxID=1052685 RepID=A0A8E2AMZ6_9APHY|nr:beach-domain-containing protein [Obba rivulosa]